MGTFYYWSGPVNSKNVVMRGVVHVVKKKSYVEPLTYKVGTIEPTYEPSGELECSFQDTVMALQILGVD